MVIAGRFDLRSNNQTSTNGTTNGNHGNLTRSQVPVQAVARILIDVNGMRILGVAVDLFILIVHLALGGGGRVVVVILVDCGHDD